MSDTSKWSAAAQWLGRQLALAPTPIVKITSRGREAGIERAELAAALGAMPGIERREGSWKLAPARRKEYWRGDGIASGRVTTSRAVPTTTLPPHAPAPGARTAPGSKRC